MTYSYNGNTITINLWPTFTDLRQGWQAEVRITPIKGPTEFRNVRFRRLFDTKDDAEKYVKAFVEKWMDNGKPEIQPGQLD